MDPRSRRRYLRGRFLGKGGFAKCFEISDADTKEVFAGKIVPKSLLLKPHQKEKMSMEISIHRSLAHQHVVGFHGFFEDNDFVFVVLELCRRRSLLELHKRRKALTEPEARYYLRQIVLGCQYLHGNRVIHRDLKLGNLFLNEDLEVKIGDFGLATKVEYDGERKKTLCGTPNYIAPEVLSKKGHSFEVDVWSIGCIMYTLLVGKPPFETSCLKETYLRIKNNEYSIPKHINPVASSLIKKMLQPDPSARPTIHELLNDEFFTSGYIPARLPITCLTIPPRFSIAPSSLDPSNRKPLTILNKGMENPVPERPREKEEPVVREASEPVDCHLSDMLQQLHSVNASKPSERGLVRQGGRWAGAPGEGREVSAPECWQLVQAPGSTVPCLLPSPVHYSPGKWACWLRPSMVRPLPSSCDSSVLSPQVPHLSAAPYAACVLLHTLSLLRREFLCGLKTVEITDPGVRQLQGLCSHRSLPPALASCRSLHG